MIRESSGRVLPARLQNPLASARRLEARPGGEGFVEVPRQPIVGSGGRGGEVTLQRGEVGEGADRVEFAGMNQAHVEIAYPPSPQGARRLSIGLTNRRSLSERCRFGKTGMCGVERHLPQLAEEAW